MKAQRFGAVALSLVTATMLGLSGCSSSDSSDSTTDGGTTTGGTTSVYDGDAVLTGTVEQVGTTTTQTGIATRAVAGDEIVKLYVVDAEGNLKDINKTCDITNGSYTCSNLADGKSYVVRYLKKIDDTRVLELKASATIPDGATAGEAPVSRVTTVIAEAIIQAVEESILSVQGIDETKVQELITQVKAAVVTAVTNLIQSGTISIPDENELIKQESFDNALATAATNENLGDEVGAVISDDTVATSLDAHKKQFEAESLATLSEKELLNQIFGDGDMEEWVVDFLADNYNQSITMSAMDSNITFFSRSDDEWMVRNLVNISGENNATVQTAITDAVTALNTAIHNGELQTDFKNAIREYYAAKADNNLTKLAEFPPVLGAVFDPNTWNPDTVTTFDNMAQSLTYIMYAEQVFAKEKIASELTTRLNMSLEDTDFLKNMDLAGFDPSFIFAALDFANTWQNYDRPEVAYFEVRMNNYWDGSQNFQFATLNFDLSRAKWMASPITYDPTKLTSVTLTYPTASGTNTVDLTGKVENRGGWPGGFEFEYSPWHDDGTPPDTSKMDIRDNVSGDYTITAVYDGDTYTTTKNMFVVNDVEKYRPKLISPLGQPGQPSEELMNAVGGWPSQAADCTSLPDGTAVKQECLDFVAEQQAYFNATGGAWYVTIATNFDANNDGTKDSVKDLVVKWDDSAIKAQVAQMNLPSNIAIAYQVGLSLTEPDIDGDGLEDWDICSMDWSQCSTEIYNTWWQDKPVTTNSLMIPKVLQANATSTTSMYNVDVTVVFIDKNTGREVAQGGNAHTSFKVGTPPALSGNETVVIDGNVTLNDPNNAHANLKIALVKQECTFDQNTYVSTCENNVTTIATPVNNTYSLNVNAKMVKDSIPIYGGSNYMVVAFDDENNNGQIDQAESPYENMYWPMDTNLWFENNGKLVVHVWDDTKEDNKDSLYIVNPDTNVSVSGINFDIY